MIVRALFKFWYKANVIQGYIVPIDQTWFKEYSFFHYFSNRIIVLHSEQILIEPIYIKLYFK